MRHVQRAEMLVGEEHITSMISILRASQQEEEVWYPLKHEVTATTRRIVAYYPMLKDKDKTLMTGSPEKMTKD